MLASGSARRIQMGPETLIFLVVIVVAVYFLSRINLAPKIKCTRCDGSGQVNEKWPDPSAIGGWHRVEGICPKCKGKGKV
jgi:hypothetical protein